jgi:hypothetical protein
MGGDSDREESFHDARLMITALQQNTGLGLKSTIRFPEDLINFTFLL